MMKRCCKLFIAAVVCSILLGSPGTAQDTNHAPPNQTQSDRANTPDQQKPHDHVHDDMPKMGADDSMGNMDMGEHQMHGQPVSLLEAVQQHSVSGTDVEPFSSPSSMLMSMKGNWMLMLHGEAFLADIQQSGPRGADKLFSTNWIMPMAQRSLR